MVSRKVQQDKDVVTAVISFNLVAPSMIPFVVLLRQRLVQGTQTVRNDYPEIVDQLDKFIPLDILLFIETVTLITKLLLLLIPLTHGGSVFGIDAHLLGEDVVIHLLLHSIQFSLYLTIVLLK